MANAIDLPAPSSKTPRLVQRPQVDEAVCKAISPKTRQPCAEPADRVVEWGDGTRTRCCGGCADYYRALAQEHKCPTYVHVRIRRIH